jgi:osmoprotectant transport system ATP-binding protein
LKIQNSASSYETVPAVDLPEKNQIVFFSNLAAMGSLALEDIHHYYGHHCALKGVTVQFQNEKITTILGKSGSGKSTLLQVLNGMIRPTKGNVFVDGQPFDYSKADEIRSLMGYVIQGVGLFPHLTVEQNIQISTLIRKVDGIRAVERMEQLMSKVHLPLSFRKKYPHELSGGEQQRVGICRALLHDPPVLLMDEPLGALDSITRTDIQQEILALQHSEPRTVVIVTHDPLEALTLADQILIVDNGEVLQHDTRKNVTEHPANELVKRLITVNIP